MSAIEPNNKELQDKLKSSNKANIQELQDRLESKLEANNKELQEKFEVLEIKINQVQKLVQDEVKAEINKLDCKIDTENRKLSQQLCLLG
jgi:hypothetical protein